MTFEIITAFTVIIDETQLEISTIILSCMLPRHCQCLLIACSQKCDTILRHDAINAMITAYKSLLKTQYCDTSALRSPKTKKWKKKKHEKILIYKILKRIKSNNIKSTCSFICSHPIDYIHNCTLAARCRQRKWVHQRTKRWPIASAWYAKRQI